MRGLADDSVTRLDKNEDLALERRDLTELHWARNFMRSKGDFQRDSVEYLNKSVKVKSAEKGAVQCGAAQNAISL